MAIRLLALDLDGTLLDSEFRIRPHTRAVLDQALAAGVRICIASGRMYCSAAVYAAELNLDDMPLVAYNGAMVGHYPSGRTLAHYPLDLDLARQLLQYCAARGYYAHVYLDDRLFVEQVDAKARDYCRIADVEAYPVGRLLDFLDRAPTKLLIYEDARQIPAIAADIRQQFGEDINLTTSFPFMLEALHPQASKGQALAEVMARLGLDRSEVMAVGDAPNDLSMLQTAGVAVAMGHGHPSLKQVADYVTAGGASDGVAEAVEALVLRA